MYKFRLRFHLSLFLKTQSTIFQHWFRLWLGVVQVTSHYLDRRWLVHRRIYASLGLNELTGRKMATSALTDRRNGHFWNTHLIWSDHFFKYLDAWQYDQFLSVWYRAKQFLTNYYVGNLSFLSRWVIVTQDIVWSDPFSIRFGRVIRCLIINDLVQIPVFCSKSPRYIGVNWHPRCSLIASIPQQKSSEELRDIYAWFTVVKLIKLTAVDFISLATVGQVYAVCDKLSCQRNRNLSFLEPKAVCNKLSRQRMGQDGGRQMRMTAIILWLERQMSQICCWISTNTYTQVGAILFINRVIQASHWSYKRTLVYMQAP